MQWRKSIQQGTYKQVSKRAGNMQRVVIRTFLMTCFGFANSYRLEQTSGLGPSHCLKQDRQFPVADGKRNIARGEVFL